MNEMGHGLQCLIRVIVIVFVVQHPKNRIVSVVNKPTVYLIAIYQIDNENEGL